MLFMENIMLLKYLLLKMIELLLNLKELLEII